MHRKRKAITYLKVLTQLFLESKFEGVSHIVQTFVNISVDSSISSNIHNLSQSLITLTPVKRVVTHFAKIHREAQMHNEVKVTCPAAATC